MSPLASWILVLALGWLTYELVSAVCQWAERKTAARCVRRCCAPAMHDEAPARLDSFGGSSSNHSHMKG